MVVVVGWQESLGEIVLPHKPSFPSLIENYFHFDQHFQPDHTLKNLENIFKKCLLLKQTWN
jgi:hypothetical protein